MSDIIYCINPRCPRPENADDLAQCQACKSSLEYGEYLYRAINPLGTQARRKPDGKKDNRLYEVVDNEDRNIKVMKVLTNNSANLVKLFKREAEILDKLRIQRNPGIPWFDSYFTFVTSNDTKLHCLVMEKIEGQNLKQWLEDNGKISQDLALKWLRQLVEILALVHQSGFLHQDIKPSNIMHKPDGQLVLIDFSDIPDIISAGYTPPEQANGKAVLQSDFFALGRTFVHLLTGIHPINLPQAPEPRRLIWRDKAPQVSQPLANLIDDLMAPSPSTRPQNAKGIRERLEQIVNHLKGWGNSKIILAGLVGLIIGTSIGIWRKSNLHTISFEQAETKICKNVVVKENDVLKQVPLDSNSGELKYDENIQAAHDAWKWACRYEINSTPPVIIEILLQTPLGVDELCVNTYKDKKMRAEFFEFPSKLFAFKCVKS